MKPGQSGFARLVDATGYSLKGLKACFRTEAAFRQELALVVVLATEEVLANAAEPVCRLTSKAALESEFSAPINRLPVVMSASPTTISAEPKKLLAT